MTRPADDPRCAWCDGAHADADCPTANPVSIGQEVGGRYRIERRLGAGGMGVVYEARHTSLGRRFALKFLAPRYAADARAVRRFETEALAAGRLEHPNVVAVVDIGREPAGLYFAMEYLDGEDCGRLLRRIGPLPIPRAVDIVAQASRGLAAAHAAGIVHRDLKPENLFVSRTGEGTDHVDVLDFGVAKLRGAEATIATTTGGTPGTAYYMAPEQARGDTDIDARADVYALGVVLYELLTGQRPFEGDSFLKVAFEILRTEPPAIESVREGIPAALATIVRKAMAKDRDARFASVDALARALVPFGFARDVAETRADAAGNLETSPSHAAATSADALVASTAHAAPPPSSVRARVALALGLAALAVGAAIALRPRAPATDDGASIGRPSAIDAVASAVAAGSAPPAAPQASDVLPATSAAPATSTGDAGGTPTVATATRPQPTHPKATASASPTAAPVKRGGVHIETAGSVRSAVRAGAVVALVAVVHASAAVAAAPEAVEQARASFQRGVALFESGRYADALEAFERAQSLAPNVVVLFNIGRVQALLDRPVEASDALARYVEQGGESLSAERRAEALELLADQRARVGSLVVRASPASAEVRVDGKLVGASARGAPIAVGRGTHVVEASLDGYRLATRAVTVAGGSVDVVELALAPLPAPPTPAPTFVTAPDPARGAYHTLGWSLVAGGGALAAFGATSLVVGYRQHQSAVDDAGRAAAAGSTGAYDDARNAVTRADRWQTAGAVTLAVGVAAAAGGVVALATTPSAPAVGVVATPGYAGFALAGAL